MRNYQWLLAGLALVAAGLIAGCGGGGSTTTGEVTGTVSGPNGSATGTVTTTSVSGATPDDVYNACIDAIKGTAAEAAGQQACSQARDAFEQCTTQASNAPEGTARDQALKACQDAADRATSALKSSTP
jgi:hypothetical protein